MDPDSVWGGEWGRSRDARVLDGGGYCQKGRGSFGVNIGHTIVTNGDFVV